MTRFISHDTFVRALRTLKGLELRRPGRTALLSYLLLKSKQRQNSGAWFEVTSKGSQSVEPEISKYLRIAPGTLLPDVNPFGSHDGALEYLAPQYERRGTYTHLYPGRNLSNVVQVRKSGRAFEVNIPRTAAADVREALGSRVPLEPAAAFFMRSHPFPDEVSPKDVIAEFEKAFDLSSPEARELFDRNGFQIEFAPNRSPDSLDILPSDLRPKLATVSQLSVARAGSMIVPLAEREHSTMQLPDGLRRRITRAFAVAKAVALIGPPGTGKSTILASLLDEATQSPGILGLREPPRYLVATADADWSSRTVVGGYYPDDSGRLVFREGVLLQAIRDNQILWIDEMNRADLDRVLGPLFTFLAGQPVDLGPTHLSDGGEPAKKMVLVWGADVASGMKEDDDQRVYHAGTDWRLLGTYNNVDRGRVFPMGAALQRRWALVPVEPAPVILAKVALDAVARPVVADSLLALYELHLRYLAVGLAPFLDMARYVGNDDQLVTEAITNEERSLLGDAYILFMGQQLVRLDPALRETFFEELRVLSGDELVTEALGF